MGKIVPMPTRPFQLLLNANKGKTIKEQFDIEANGEKIPVELRAPDIFLILKEQEKSYQLEYADCMKRGLHEYPVNEAQWEKEIAVVDDPEVRKTLEEDKPVNLAEQIAKKNSRFDTIRTLIPKVLRDQGGDLFCKDMNEQRQLEEIISSNAAMMNTLTRKYIDIMKKMRVVGEEVKNSPEQEGSTSS